MGGFGRVVMVPPLSGGRGLSFPAEALSDCGVVWSCCCMSVASESVVVVVSGVDERASSRGGLGVEVAVSVGLVFLVGSGGV